LPKKQPSLPRPAQVFDFQERHFVVELERHQTRRSSAQHRHVKIQDSTDIRDDAGLVQRIRDD
jgi:hypothetical protein